MTDDDLTAFCDAMIENDADPSVSIPERFVHWNDIELQAALVAMARAARSSVALRAEVQRLREALEPLRQDVEHIARLRKQAAADPDGDTEVLMSPVEFLAIQETLAATDPKETP